MSGHPNYPELAYLFGASFHQDRDAAGDDRTALVRDAVALNTSARRG